MTLASKKTGGMTVQSVSSEIIANKVGSGCAFFYIFTFLKHELSTVALCYYCWWKKSCTTWDIPNSVNNGINYLSTGAGLIPSTVCPCSDCSSSMESTILQVRPVYLSPPVADLKFLNVVVCSCLEGAYPMAYSFLEKGWETWGNSLQSNSFKHSTFGSLAKKNLTMALLVASALTNCGMIIHHYNILSISEYANVFQTKTLVDSGKSTFASIPPGKDRWRKSIHVLVYHWPLQIATHSSNLQVNLEEQPWAQRHGMSLHAFRAAGKEAPW